MVVKMPKPYNLDHHPAIALLGPTMTRPALNVIPRLETCVHHLWSADPECDHYITYGIGGGVRCIRCSGWYCA